MPTPAETLLERFLSSRHNIKFIRLQWVDYSGVLRTRIITNAVCKRLASGEEQYSLAQNCMVIPISIAPACLPDGIEDWKLRPDWESLTACGFAPAHASVMCSTAHTGLVDPLARCPRALMVTVVEAFQSKHHTKLLMGFEIEFVLLDECSDLDVKSMDRTVGFSMTAGLRAENLVILEQIVGALELSGIEVYHFHTELADQFEIALSPLPPIPAIDALMMAQETIRTVSVRHGLRASMTPRPVLSGPRNGMHVHLSLNPPVKSTFFLAGVLEKLTALCAFGLPNYDSYCRVAGDCAGEWVAWGTGNKDLPIRQVCPGRWEFRFLDATANKYLFIAALVLSGMNGMELGRELTMRDCDVVPSVFDQVETAREHLAPYGVTESMPTTLSSALLAAQSDEDIENWTGAELLSQYVKVKKTEVRRFSQMTDEERRHKFLSYF